MKKTSEALLQLTWPYGDWCIYCGQDAETCEHFEEQQPSETFAERGE